MSILEAIIQGIVQGLTEFLPISSSGHLSVIQYFTGQNGESGLLFTILLHFGTLLAVFIAFWPTIWGLICEFFRLIGDLCTRRFSVKRMSPQRRMLLMLMLSLVPLLFFVLFSDFYKSVSSDNSIVVEGVCFLITGCLLLLADKNGRGHTTAKNMRPRDAVAMGIAQGIAPLPGISRSGSTVAAGLLMGLDRTYAVAFSFIMGVPAVLAANVLEVGDALAEQAILPWPVLLAGILSAVIFGLLAIKMVNWIITTDKFKIFAFYTLILGAIVLACGLVDTFGGHVIQNAVIGFLR